MIAICGIGGYRILAKQLRSRLDIMPMSIVSSSVATESSIPYWTPEADSAMNDLTGGQINQLPPVHGVGGLQEEEEPQGVYGEYFC